MSLHKHFFFWAIAAFALGSAFFSLIFVNQQIYILLATEGAYTELATAIFYLVSGCLLLASAKKIYASERAVSAIIFTCLLGLFFIFIAGEEESWGQWIFSFETPAEYAERNAQGEVNIHNLDIFAQSSLLDPHRVLKLFVLTFAIILPVIYYAIHALREILDTFNFPIVPIELAPIFLMALFFEKISHHYLHHWANAEFMEFFFSIGFLVFSFSYFKSVASKYKEISV